MYELTICFDGDDMYDMLTQRYIFLFLVLERGGGACFCLLIGLSLLWLDILARDIYLEFGVLVGGAVQGLGRMYIFYFF